ncbi:MULTISPECIES: NUDIX hydrolase [Brevibacterium]|uniref:NUDIX hydrolase n=1 Tax=Brevibacterium TaxID=1696 RepID=UPI000C41D40F|nr:MULTISPECIES: NUDIX domain-containing protein [Brevibacterium]SMX95451.1 ADP-ribose pyrophosphatase YjhB, NUDIX family [Brevibacterium sp. 239c]
MNDIRVSALVLLHPYEPFLLMVRKEGTSSFMLPGGKPEVGESAEATIIREISEELGLVLEADHLFPLGTFAADAANEADHQVIGDVFCYEGLPAELNVDCINHQAEIAEAAWFPYDPMPADTSERQFAPLTRLQVVPALAERGLLTR